MMRFFETHDEREEGEGTDFGPMFHATCAAAALVLGTKIVASLVLANRLGVGVRLAMAWGWLPSLQFVTDRVTFSRITSESTLAMAIVGAVAFAVTVIVGLRRQTIAGWWCAVLSIIETLLVELLLHLIEPPFFSFVWMRWTLVVLAAALAITASWLAIERPWRSDPPADPGKPTPHTALAGS